MSTLVALPMDQYHSSSASQVQPRRHKKMLRDGSGEVWPDHAEVLFSRAIAEYDRQSALSSNSGSPYPPDLPSRNEFIVRYLKERGLERSKQQVASHIQQLKKRSSKEGGMGGSGSSNGSSPIASPSTLTGGGTWINPYTGMTSPAPTNSLSGGPQAFYTQQQQQPYSIPSSPSYHRSPISPSTSHFVPSSSHSSPHSMPASPPSSTGAITSLQIRLGNSGQSINIPLGSTSSSLNQGGISIQTLSSNSLKIRLLVPPHSNPLAHLQAANIFAVIGLRNEVFQRLTGRMIANRIWADGRSSGEETDMFDVKSSSSSSNSVSIIAPLRLNGAALLGQDIGVLTVNQTIYGPPSSSNGSSYPSSTPSALMNINYEFVHAAHPGLPPQQQHAQQQMMSYGVMGNGSGYGNSNMNSLSNVWGTGANAGPFTQF